MIDAIVVGSGPNGLAAAATLAHAGLGVRVVEREQTVGGGLRTEELTLPGFRHDLCSAVHPAALHSPFFRAWGLAERVALHVPEVSYAHPLDGRPAALAWRDLDRTVAGLGRSGPGWRRLFEPLLDRLDGVCALTGGPLLRPPADPVAAGRFLGRTLARGAGLRDEAAALFAGVAAHSGGPLPSLAATGAGLALAVQGHGRGWGLPLGGAQAIADALAADIRAHGGEIVTDVDVEDLGALEPARAVLLDVAPERLARMAPLPKRYRRALARLRRGVAVAKLDLALAAAVPWSDPDVALSPTVHLGGTAAELAASERAVHAGRVSERPFVLVVQPSVADPSRAPAGRHTLWAYLHVPLGSGLDPTPFVLGQLERFAPGIGDLVLGTAVSRAPDIAARNANDVGGEIMGGAVTLRQLLARPVLSPQPWRTPLPGVYLASASTPPGPAVHGMAGWLAARLALRERFGIRETPFGDYFR
ncbi:MAG: NAD(P)/FAD-dependent oxidoreductase [Microbacteriaceae bacterium]